MAFTRSAPLGPHGVVLENGAGHPALNSFGNLDEPTSLPESVARAFNAQHQELLARESEPLTYGHRVEAREALAERPLRAHSPADESMPADQTAAPDPQAATWLRYLYPVSVSAILLAAIVLSVYYFELHSMPGTPLNDVGQVAPGSARAPFHSGSPPSALPAQGESASGRTLKKFVFRALGLDSESAFVPPLSGNASTTRPSPATNGEARALQDLPRSEECQEALVALGLCNPVPKQESP